MHLLTQYNNPMTQSNRESFRLWTYRSTIGLEFGLSYLFPAKKLGLVGEIFTKLASRDCPALPVGAMAGGVHWSDWERGGVDGDWGGLRCGGVDGVAALFVAGGKNFGQHLVRISFDCFVANAQNPEAPLFQVFGTGRVALPLLIMDSAIDFYDQTGFGAVKVCDKATNRMLSPYFQTTQSAVTHLLPEQLFSLCHLAA